MRHTPAGRRRHGRNARLAIRLVLAAAVLAEILISAVDPHAAERDPYHDHVVVGGDAIQQARAVAAHKKGADVARPAPVEASVESRRDDHPASPTPATASDHCVVDTCVLAIRAARALGVSIVGTSGSAMLARPWRLFVDPRPTARIASAPIEIPLEVTVLVPEPPPRPS